MHKGLLFIGIALLFTGYHIFIDGTISVGMYATSINNNLVSNFVGIAILLSGFTILYVSFSNKET